VLAFENKLRTNAECFNENNLHKNNLVIKAR